MFNSSNIFLIYKRWIKHSNKTRAAAISFYTVFSFAPLLYLLMFIFKIFFNSKDLTARLSIENFSFLNVPTTNFIKAFIDSNITFDDLSLFSFLVLSFSSSLVFIELRESMDNIWFDGDKSKYKQKIIKTIFYRLISLLISPLIIVIFFINILLKTSFMKILKFIDLVDYAYALQIVELTLSVVISWVIFVLIIRFLPSWRANLKSIALASIFISLIYELGKYLFSFYIQNSNLASLYGATSSFVFFLIWIYFLVLTFLLGIELLRIIEQKT